MRFRGAHVGRMDMHMEPWGSVGPMWTWSGLAQAPRPCDDRRPIVNQRFQVASGHQVRVTGTCKHGLLVSGSCVHPRDAGYG